MNVQHRLMEVGLFEDLRKFPCLKIRQMGHYSSESIDIQIDLHPIMLGATTATGSRVWEALVILWRTDAAVVYFYLRKIIRYVCMYVCIVCIVCVCIATQ